MSCSRTLRRSSRRSSKPVYFGWRHRRLLSCGPDVRFSNRPFEVKHFQTIPYGQNIKTARKSGSYPIPAWSRRVSSARFFWGDQGRPSRIGGQKGDARCDVNCDDWTDPPLREPTTLECYRRSHKIALAELDAANRACPTRRLKTKTAPRFSPGAA
jgi:hypothetical protein